MNVDLPEPFGPVRPYRRPAENVVDTSSKRILDPKRIETPLTEIMRRVRTPYPQVLFARGDEAEPPIVTYRQRWRRMNGPRRRVTPGRGWTSSWPRKTGWDRERRPSPRWSGA